MKTHQQGVGLIEVLVALMLLSVAILGFTAMQMNAVKATDESVMRTRALTVIRGGSETMRSNLNAIPAFVAGVNASQSSVTPTGTSVAVTKNSCTNDTANLPATCTAVQLATRDGLTVKDYAARNDLQINLVTCPGTVGKQERRCFITSWGKTAPQLDPTAPPANTTNCADADGVYKMGAQCFIMESY